MLPTLGSEDEWVFCVTLPQYRRPPVLQRGDLIFAHSPLTPSKEVCKRILGLPGDTILTDPSGIERPRGEHVTVPEGHVWLGGDNLRESLDSRVWGPVPWGMVRGKVVARVSKVAIH